MNKGELIYRLKPILFNEIMNFYDRFMEDAPARLNQNRVENLNQITIGPSFTEALVSKWKPILFRDWFLGGKKRPNNGGRFATVKLLKRRHSLRSFKYK